MAASIKLDLRSASYGYQINPATGDAFIGHFSGAVYGSGWGREFAVWDTAFRVSAGALEPSAHWGWNTAVFEYYDWISTAEGSLARVGPCRSPTSNRYPSRRRCTCWAVG